jgi:dolichol-phosphate mannosyltransferase
LTQPPRGITTVLMLLLMNLGVMSLGIGILGEYIAKIYAESKRRPLWFVDYTLNFTQSSDDSKWTPPIRGDTHCIATHAVAK